MRVVSPTRVSRGRSADVTHGLGSLGHLASAITDANLCLLAHHRTSRQRCAGPRREDNTEGRLTGVFLMHSVDVFSLGRSGLTADVSRISGYDRDGPSALMGAWPRRTS